jgi:phenylpropionate dioxygenase-like ring-hydroxylating dioxygenase large terminal subunit
MSMLEDAPWLLAHRSMLEANQPIKVSLYGCDYVLWKDRTGNVGVLPNTCPHMGAMSSEGWCHQQDQSSAIVCPFQALHFDTLGCTTLPGTKKKTLSQLEPLELITRPEKSGGATLPVQASCCRADGRWMKSSGYLL